MARILRVCLRRLSTRTGICDFSRNRITGDLRAVTPIPISGVNSEITSRPFVSIYAKRGDRCAQDVRKATREPEGGKGKKPRKSHINIHNAINKRLRVSRSCPMNPLTRLEARPTCCASSAPGLSRAWRPDCLAEARRLRGMWRPLSSRSQYRQLVRSVSRTKGACRRTITEKANAIQASVPSEGSL